MLKILSLLLFLNISIYSFGEITFSMIKPHAVKSKDHIKIEQMIKMHDFKILKRKRVIMTRAKLNQLYREHKHKPFFKDVQEASLGKRVIVLILEKDNAVADYRELMGDKEPQNAKNGTIRKLFGIDTTRNAVHGSDSEKSAVREVSIFFPEFNLKKYIS